MHNAFARPRADTGIVRDSVALNSSLAHFVEDQQCTLPLRALSTRTDTGIVRDGAARDASLAHLIEELQSTLPLRTLFTRTDGGTVCDGVARNVSLIISSKSFNACCHCAPFSRALILALYVMVLRGAPAWPIFIE